MSKSRILMWAYIFFLLIIVVLHAFYNLDVTRKISLAATVSSLLFALSDYYRYCYDKINSKWEAYLNTEKTYIELIKSTLEVVKKEVDEINFQLNASKGISNSNENYPENARKYRRILKDLKKARLSIESEIEESNTKVISPFVKLVKTAMVFESIMVFVMFFVGILVFFLCITLDQVFKYLTPFQDVLTILSFALIMLMYLLRDKQTSSEKALNVEAEAVVTKYNARKKENENYLSIMDMLHEQTEHFISDYEKEH